MHDNGLVNKDHLIHYLSRYGEKLSEEEIDEILECTQLKRTKEIEIEYFVKAICGRLDDE